MDAFASYADKIVANSHVGFGLTGPNDVQRAISLMVAPYNQMVDYVHPRTVGHNILESSGSEEI
jgi:hypothetical protein